MNAERRTEGAALESFGGNNANSGVYLSCRVCESHSATGAYRICRRCSIRKARDEAAKAAAGWRERIENAQPVHRRRLEPFPLELARLREIRRLRSRADGAS